MDGTIPPDDQPVTRTEAEGATVDLPEGLGFFTTGQVLGDRYEILEMPSVRQRGSPQRPQSSSKRSKG